MYLFKLFYYYSGYVVLVKELMFNVPNLMIIVRNFKTIGFLWTYGQNSPCVIHFQQSSSLNEKIDDASKELNNDYVSIL